jgi:hypothetical protein
MILPPVQARIRLPDMAVLFQATYFVNVAIMEVPMIIIGLVLLAVRQQ